jgi:integrase
MTEKRRGPKEGSIFERKDGRWCACVHIGYDPKTGLRLRKYVYGASYDDVLDKKRALEERQRRGEPVRFDRQSVGAYLEQWLAAIEGSVRPKTYDTYATHIRLHILPALGTRNLDDLKPPDVIAWLNRLKRHDPPLSERTIQDIYDLLNRAQEQAVRWGMASRNVVALVDRPRATQAEIRALDKAQVDTLLKAVQDVPEWRTLYLVAVSTGVRRGELLGLKWQDIDLDRAKLMVRRSLSRLRGALVFGEVKTKRSRRTINLSRACVEALRAHKAWQASERKRLGNAWIEHGLVFPTGVGTPMEPRNLARRLDQDLARAKLPHIRIHDLRHTYASLMIAEHVEIALISETLGHANVSTTYNIYVHLLDSQRNEGADAMDRLFGG